MNKKLILFVGLIIFLNIFIINKVVSNQVDMVDVYVSSTRIEARTKIKEEHLKKISMASISVGNKVYLSKKDILNKYTDIQGDIPRGSMFFKEMLYEEKELPDLPRLKLKKGQSVFSMNTDLLKMSGNSIVEDSKVDVYISSKAKYKEDAIIRKVLENVRVIDVKDKKGKNMNDSDSKTPYVVSLAINNNYIELLLKYLEEGKITIFTSNANSKEECKYVGG